MAVTETANPFFSALWSPSSLNWPLGQWGCTHQATGDATGGGFLVNILQPADDWRRFILNFEWVSLVSAGAGGNRMVEVESFIPVSNPAPEALTARWTSASPEQTGQGVREASPGIVIPRRFLVHWGHGNTDTQRIATLSFNTNTDGVIYTVSVGGFYWSRDALSIAGGPLFPS